MWEVGCVCVWGIVVGLIFGKRKGEGVTLYGENSMHATRFSRVVATHAPNKHTHTHTNGSCCCMCMCVCACSGKRVVFVRKTRKSKPGIGSVCQMRESWESE